jgi:hypothetical protein
MMDDQRGLMGEDVRHVQLPPAWQPAARMGAKNSVFFQAEDLPSDTEYTRREKGGLWAGGQLLQWSPQEVGEELKFRLPVSESGQYAIHITAAMTPKSGDVAAALDGNPLRLTTEEGTMKLRTDFRTLSRTFSTPPRELAAGEHELSLRWLGAVPPQDAATVGIDFIWFQSR